MPDVTDAHREEARRAIMLAGMPAPEGVLDKSRRRELVEAVAAAVSLAEVRGPAGGRTDPTDAEEAAFGNGLAAAFREVAATFAARGHTASVEIVRTLAAAYSIDLPAAELEGRAAARAERMSWSPGDLVITPPPAEDGER